MKPFARQIIFTGRTWKPAPGKNQVRNALKQSEKRFRQVIENAHIPMVITDAQGRIEFINRQFTKTFGYTRKELPTCESWWALACPGKAERKEVSRQLSPEYGDEKTDPDRPGDIKVTAKDGSTRNIKFTHTPMGEISLTTLIDITKRKRALKEKQKLQEQLQQAQKMEAIGTLAGGIAHDFNNILSAIIGYTELARIHALDRDKLVGNLAGVLKASERAGQLVRQILTFSRSSQQERIPVKMDSVIKEAVKLLQATLPSTIDIDVTIAPHCGAVLADPTQLHQVVMNLCTNAAHAMEQECGTLAVTLEEVEETPVTQAENGNTGQGHGRKEQCCGHRPLYRKPGSVRPCGDRPDHAPGNRYGYGKTASLHPTRYSHHYLQRKQLASLP